MSAYPVLTPGIDGSRLWIGNEVVFETSNPTEAVKALNRARTAWEDLQRATGRDLDRAIRELPEEDIEAALWWRQNHGDRL